MTDGANGICLGSSACEVDGERGPIDSNFDGAIVTARQVGIQPERHLGCRVNAKINAADGV